VGSDRPIDRVLGVLEGVERHNGYLKALCPAHDDRSPSLDIKEVGDNDQKKVILKCQAGCETAAVLEKVGLEWKDLFSSDGAKSSDGARRPGRIVATYDYTDAAGNLLHQTVRYEPKRFLQRRPDGEGSWIWGLGGIEPVLYNLPRIYRALLDGDTIYVLEGEKDCNRAWEELGVTATTCSMGAQKWRESYTHVLAGANVIVVPDNDEPGGDHAEMVATELFPFAASVKILKLPDLPEKGDLSSWIDAGGTREEFDRLVSKTPQFFLPTKEPGFGEKEFLPVKSLREVVAEAEETPDFLVKNLLKKGELTDLSGLAKYSGKTTLVMHMLKAVRDGDLFLGELTKAARILYLTEQGNNFKEAIGNAALDLDDDGFVVIQHRDVRAEEWTNLVEKAVKLCESDGRDVLVVDTFAAFTKLVGSEENNSGDIRSRMEPLKKAAQSHDLAVLVIRHAGKDGRGRGSSQFEAEVDIVATLKRPEGNHAETVRQLETIGRYGATKLNIELTEAGYVPLGSDEKVAFNKAVRTIKGVLPRRKENAVTEDFLTEKARGEVSKGTLIRALRWLVDQETVVREGSGKKGSPYTYWLPPRDPQRPNSFSPNPYPIGGEKETDEKAEGGTDSWGSYELVTDPDRLPEVAAFLEGASEVAIDLETTGLDPRKDSIRLLSLATTDVTYIVDCQSVDPAGLFPILTKAAVVAHNALFDLGFLAVLGFVSGKVVDTMILSQLLYAGSKVEPLKRGQTSHSLDSVAKRELGLELDKTHQSSDWGATLTTEMIEYAAKDVEVLLPLYEVLKTKIGEAGLAHVAEIEHRALPAVVWMSSAGVPIDADGWRRHALKADADAARLGDKLKALAPEHPDGKEWNFGSPQQVRKAAKLLGVDLPDTKDETLALYANDNNFIAALRDYRKVTKLANTYGAAWLDSGYYRDGRIYASWRQLRAATGRMACDHPNLQNIPRSGPLRSYIRAPEERVFVVADYSQIELRIAAKISGNTEMLSAYAEGRDLHTLTGQSLSGKEEISKDDRKLAKAVNFGLLYGMGVKGLQTYALKSYGVEMSLEEATHYRRRFFQTYPRLREWHEHERRAWQRGDTETRTLTGRRRTDVERLTDRLNAPVQGTGADGLKLALTLLWERRDECPGAVPVLVCHDEVVVECDAEQAGEVKAWLEKAMIEGMEAVLSGMEEVGVPVEVDARIARSWGEGD
jgi:DNA polymerase I-like protein with 3'-5' exonuclease and polymerase domains